MPPMTSRRPGARLRRIGREKSNSADSSRRVRSISVGIGSRRRSSVGRLIAWHLLRRWLTCRRAGRRAESAKPADRLRRRRRRRLAKLFGRVRAECRLKNELIEESPAAGERELRRQHVRQVLMDAGETQGKGVGAAGAVPAITL